MARYNTICLDEKSTTRTALTAASLKAGMLVKLNSSGAFVVHSTAGKKQDFVYLMNVDYLQGKKADDVITVGDTGVGEMFTTDRECAGMVVAGEVLKLDTPLTSNGLGSFRIAVLGTDEVISYSCEPLTVAAGGELVRMRAA